MTESKKNMYLEKKVFKIHLSINYFDCLKMIKQSDKVMKNGKIETIPVSKRSYN